MRPNVRLLGSDVIQMQREREARLNALAAMAREEADASIEMLAYAMTLGIVVTGCLLVIAL